MNGRSARSLFVAFTNIAPGVDEERFHRWYEELHRPDSIEFGMFTHSSRYEASSPSNVRFLTLWEADYSDLDAALRTVRAGAQRLRGAGRIWPVQTVLFQQFVFAAEPGRSVPAPVATLTTACNDWAHPAREQSGSEWQAELPKPALDAYHSATSYACACYGDATTARRLWLGESSAPPEQLEKAWEQGGAAHALPPFGAPIPIFLPEGSAPAAGPAASDATDDAAARSRVFAVHWRPVESRYRTE